MPPCSPPHKSTRDVGRALAGALVFAAGLLSAASFAGASPAAQKDCVPVVGCITTALPTVTLPTVSVPTVLPTTTNGTPPQTTPGSTTQTTPESTTGSTATAPSPAGAAGSPFTARASVRVLGRRGRRVVQITVRLNKEARLTALLTRNGRSLLRKEFAAKQGSRIFRLRVRTTTRAGLARLWLTYRTAAKEGAKATYRIRLPR